MRWDSPSTERATVNLIIHLCPVEPSVTLCSVELSTAAVLKWAGGAVAFRPMCGAAQCLFVFVFFIAKSSGRWYFAHFICNEWLSVQLTLWPQSLFQLLPYMFVNFFLVFPPLIPFLYGILYADFYWLVCIPVLIILILIILLIRRRLRSRITQQW